MGGVKINASIRRKYYSLEEILLLEENQPREMIRKKAKNRQRKTNGEAKNMKRMLEDITSKKQIIHNLATQLCACELLVTDNSTINFAKLQILDIRKHHFSHQPPFLVPLGF